MGNLIQSVLTKQDLVNQLKKLGVTSSMILEVHVAYELLPFVVGGAKTVVDALMEVAKDGGTIMMHVKPKHAKDPTFWNDANISTYLYEDIRKNTPAFDPRFCELDNDPIVENFRNRDGVEFSSHPAYCYAAWGRYAKFLCNKQSLHFPLAEESPVARLYELKGYVLNLGCSFTELTCLHLAQYRSDCCPIGVSSSCLNGQGNWQRYLDLEVDASQFKRIRSILLNANQIRSSMLGDCEMELFSVPLAIDEATKYFEKTVVYDLYR